MSRVPAELCLPLVPLTLWTPQVPPRAPPTAPRHPEATCPRPTAWALCHRPRDAASPQPEANSPIPAPTGTAQLPPDTQPLLCPSLLPVRATRLVCASASPEEVKSGGRTTLFPLGEV